ncbi:MAG: hypothetical protein KA132_03595, partial [Thauera sp.]|nr:hypothetical protein [Thauera sp.]
MTFSEEFQGNLCHDAAHVKRISAAKTLSACRSWQKRKPLHYIAVHMHSPIGEDEPGWRENNGLCG